VQVQLAAIHLSARFAFRLAAVVEVEYKSIHRLGVVVGVSCLLAETGLLPLVQQVVERQGLVVATPYLVAVVGVVPLPQAANLFTVAALVAVAITGLVLAL
jgi:hypothetical protein